MSRVPILVVSILAAMVGCAEVPAHEPMLGADPGDPSADVRPLELPPDHYREGVPAPAPSGGEP